MSVHCHISQSLHPVITDLMYMMMLILVMGNILKENGYRVDQGASFFDTLIVEVKNGTAQQLADNIVIHGAY